MTAFLMSIIYIQRAQSAFGKYISCCFHPLQRVYFSEFLHKIYEIFHRKSPITAVG